MRQIQNCNASFTCRVDASWLQLCLMLERPWSQVEHTTDLAWWMEEVRFMILTSNIIFNPIKSYKNYLQNRQHMVLCNRPTLSIGTERLACLNSPPWHAALDPRLARGRSRVWAPGPAGALRTFFSPLSLPPSGDSFFRTFPHQTHESVRVNGLYSQKRNNYSPGISLTTQTWFCFFYL